MKKNLFLFLSLFFSEADLKVIQNHFTPLKEERQNVSLNSLIYTDENHWSLWINHQLYQPQTIHQLKGYKLIGIGQKGAKFFCLKYKRLFFLQPDQTYVQKKQKVFEAHQIGIQ
ncbi:MAG: hypothetical protein ACD_16C00132G0007 [uncultured bacterium]|nr:MAG: hypothetical protein ACD_16C00132G0007 [uncultured bacterium]OFW69552.1 MAG: hypothetical protein A2X70_00860 [Alphaproteobacteria bacterium GWC2_42_16]OFW74076.1 MAG: hypothetical protein A2Z80_04525 [Alphaproteobacteria bacterium GWA2_41_27]OFW84384.1 MAG: hypothetical protein A3E50_03210 [Alphaproteobacteria bacterium RIFCSPHIGHO2_12_FULL_42_100]OFW85905.1 MAG: hypothetical protein A2W06_05090 [Alphaproteobacteria bacterium RBG_16_42_14]OFW92230.1 MAG: hypothetical protein A3C41_028